MPELPLAFIFDMDGTVLDNMAFHTEAWMETIDALGRPPVDPAEWEQRTSGVPNRTIFADMLGVARHEVPDWVERKEAAYRRLAAGRLEPLPGLHRFLDEAVDMGVGLAMATGAGPANIEFNLDALDLHRYFPIIVGADDVTHGKPDPEVFLTAAYRLEARPERCVVFEDAPLGIEAAMRAGMRTVVLTTMLTSESAQSVAFSINRRVSTHNRLPWLEPIIASSFEELSVGTFTDSPAGLSDI